METNSLVKYAHPARRAEMGNRISNTKRYIEQVHTHKGEPESSSWAWMAGEEFKSIKDMIPRGKWGSWKKDWKKEAKKARFAGCSAPRTIELYMQFRHRFDSAQEAARLVPKGVGSLAESAYSRKRAARRGIYPVTRSAAFGSERDLQLALRSDITLLEPRLKIIDGGSEKYIKGGRIDITAEDHNGSLVVIELKADTAHLASVAQLLNYMGTMMESIENPEGKPVRGILIANNFDDKVVRAARPVPSISLKPYYKIGNQVRPFVHTNRRGARLYAPKQSAEPSLIPNRRSPASASDTPQ